ncbi:MAG: S-layer homology domain-containing protein [Clostridiales Family XIII bacterium]|nr:S-layer homology domain-containing protein [Clostridiales Family XIII bacterium]
MMTKGRARVALCIALLLAAASVLTGFTRVDGIGNVYYSADMEIFEGVSFSRVLAGNDASGVERAYIVTADPSASSIRPVVFSGESSGRYVLDTMVGTLEAQGYKVVAGINGDIFSTDSACPRSLTIHDGVIQSSGYDSQFVISFDSAGKAELSWTNVNYGLSTQIFLPQEDGTYLLAPFNANIGFFNVPHGAAKALHLYNRTYGPSTMTSGDNVEVVLDTESYDAAQLRFGRAIRARVAWIQYSGANTPIGDNQLVLSTDADSATAEALRMMSPGMDVEIYATDLDNGPISRASECLGMYYLIYNNGTWVSTGERVNPRTCIGIKRDGSVMLYVLDGRQAGVSGGLGLTDVAKHMIALGCVVVANLDGGGSSTMVVREPGRDDRAVTKNSPSDGKQRAVANGLFYVYRPGQNAGGQRLSVYQDNYLAMPGASVQLTPYMTNALYEKSGYYPAGNLTYSILEGDGEVSRYGLFTASENEGVAVVQASGDGVEATVRIGVHKGVSLNPSQKSIFLEPGQTVDVNMNATYGYSAIAQRDDLFTWECDENIGTINEVGIFTAGERTGTTGEIRVSYGNERAAIPVQVGLPVTFDDLLDSLGNNHWARPYIEGLAGRGLVNGVADRQFAPDEVLTRAQFLAMLAKTLDGIDINAAPQAGFTDVAMQDWYYAYVNWGFATGVVRGVDEGHFEPGAEITREQMAVMLDNFAALERVPMPELTSPPAFSDAELISQWSAGAVGKVVKAGLMNGLPEGGFEPQGVATRAQAAKLAFLYFELKNATQPYPGFVPGYGQTLPGQGGDAGSEGISGGGISSGPGISGPSGTGSTSGPGIGGSGASDGSGVGGAGSSSGSGSGGSGASGNGGAGASDGSGIDGSEKQNPEDSGLMF